MSPSAEQAEYKQVTVLFADVVGSMRLAASLGAEELRDVVAKVFNRSAVAVERYGGTVDKFTGDGIMAVFGAPKALADPCGAAWSAVQDMFRGLDRLNGELAREGRAPFAMGAGMAFGEAVVGHVGSRERFNYTAVGDSANVAARLQDQAKRLGLRAVVSGEAKAHLAGAPLEPLGAIAIEGREPVEAWGWRG